MRRSRDSFRDCLYSKDRTRACDSLVELYVICARHHHHDDATVFELLDRTRNCAPFAVTLRPSSRYRRTSKRSNGDVVIISFAFPDAVRWVHTHLARSRSKDEPIVIPIFGHILPAEHVAQKARVA